MSNSDIIIGPVPARPDAGTSPPNAPRVAPPAEASPDKPRSGFQRQKIKIQRLTDLYQNLQLDHEALRDEHDKLLRDFHELDDAFNEVTQLNAELAAELRQARHRQPTQHPPVRFGDLMGLMR
jgi:hypothetical protein